MTLHTLLGEKGAQLAEKLFGTEAMKTVESQLFDKKGKPYLKCQSRKKDILGKPEELIRQLWLHRLTHHYNYPLGRITVEYPVTFGRDSSKRADIVVFDVDRPTVPSLSNNIERLRQKLIESGVMKINGDHYRVTQNYSYSFSSPSTAASVVMGRSANGRTEWKEKSGKTLKAIQKALAND